jgi:hypothetical protein
MLLGLKIPKEKIFCTSLREYGIPGGVDFKDYILRTFHQSTAVVALISKNYYQSAFCMCELGAVWVSTDKPFFPLLLQDVTASDLRGTLAGLQCLKINSDEDLDSLRKALSTVGLANVDNKKWTEVKTGFLDELQDKSPSKLFVAEELLVDKIQKKLGKKALTRIISALENGEESMDPYDMRNLPAFIEDSVGEAWESGNLSISSIHKHFGRIILLCRDSEYLWSDEEPPRSNKYWSLFNRLVAAMEEKVKHASKNG